MGKFKITKSEIEGVFTVEPTVFGDERGYFMETYNENVRMISRRKELT